MADRSYEWAKNNSKTVPRGLLVDWRDYGSVR